eukprot:CAMPEP_0185178952 /NCGR_PEP_ID=MMETSP1139-20130426/31768_1 /TAXON_ID=298111 /ORGANISM="Pavlova sp., Strain CCMP459" /LENGTH=93 /DNA_ID=CAMNT_0027744787 /DNA_START=540 /DNA_END=822 /DNA_ORIENTATION=+
MLGSNTRGAQTAPVDEEEARRRRAVKLLAPPIVLIAPRRHGVQAHRVRILVPLDLFAWRHGPESDVTQAHLLGCGRTSTMSVSGASSARPSRA